MPIWGSFFESWRTIQRISQYRMLRFTKVDAYLMRSTSLQSALHHRSPTQLLQWLYVGNGSLTFICRLFTGSAQPVSAVTVQYIVYGLLLCPMTTDQSPIATRDRSCFQLRLQFFADRTPLGRRSSIRMYLHPSDVPDKPRHISYIQNPSCSILMPSRCSNRQEHPLVYKRRQNHHLLCKITGSRPGFNLGAFGRTSISADLASLRPSAVGILE